MTRDAEQENDAPRIVSDVVCGFCGLACDDLEVEVSGAAVRVVRACADATALLTRNGAVPPTPRVCGRPASLEDATRAAASHLSTARAAAMTGLGADLSGLRRLYDIAVSAGASFDHWASGGLFANLERLSRRGWIAATLAEVRNRCDLLVVLGPDPSGVFPRLFEKMMPALPRATDSDTPPLFIRSEPTRQVVVLGGPLSEAARTALRSCEVSEIALTPDQVAPAAAALAGLLAGRSGMPLEKVLPEAAAAELPAVAERLKAAHYAVFTWNAGTFAPEDAASVAEAAAAAVDHLSVATRAAVFPLGGADNVTGAHQMSLWRFGYPLRTVVGAGTARHAPELYATAAALKDADLVLHASAFRPSAPPAFEGGPVIALCHPDTVFAREPDVFIPVGTPGVDHAGHVFRMDAVVCLPLKALRSAGLPSMAEAASAILGEIRRPS